MKPARIELFPSGEIGIVWDDGREDFFNGRDLRLACPCAACVDEMTGERTLQPSHVPAAVRALGWTPVGSYAVHFLWSDAHQSGIYSFEMLRGIGDR